MGAGYRIWDMRIRNIRIGKIGQRRELKMKSGT